MCCVNPQNIIEVKFVVLVVFPALFLTACCIYRLFFATITSSVHSSFENLCGFRNNYFYTFFF